MSDNWRWKAYPSEQAAIETLTAQGFRFNAARNHWVRGDPHVSQSRYSVERCKNNQWVLSESPINHAKRKG